VREHVLVDSANGDPFDLAVWMIVGKHLTLDLFTGKNQEVVLPVTV
jgi:hypothetical protein